MTTFSFLTMPDWVKKNHPECVGVMECTHCDGQGEHECNLGYTHECEDCNGKGKVEVFDIPDNIKQEYYQQKRRDEALLANLLGTKP